MNIPQTIRGRNEARLAGIHPDLAATIRRILAAMEVLGCPMLVTDGVRTAEEQRALYAKGRTTPGPDVSPERPMGRTVTNADGVLKKSNHQPHPDGYGHAVDCAFLIDGADHDGEYETVTWDLAPEKWDLFGAAIKASGLKWGADFTGIVDRPHAELKG